MKVINRGKKMVQIFVGLLVVCSFSSGPGKGCDLESLFESNASTLQPYTFMKKFDVQVNKNGEKVEYSYVLSRDSEYKILILDFNEEGKKMVVNFYDRNKKLITSNYLKSSKKIFPSITYKCAATGVYYIEAYFEGEKNGCGVNVIGFKK